MSDYATHQKVAGITGAGKGTGGVPARRAGLAWPRLPAIAELATIAAGYAAYSLVRLAIRAGHQVAFTHAAQLWQAERRLHLTAEPFLNHLAAGHLIFAQASGYYYGLLHFLVTPLVLAWLYLRRPAAFARLRSALVLATAAATAVFWAWPVAPPRFSVPGMTDIMVAHDILSAAHPRGATSLVNLYAAMPSLHVGWAAWCALAVVTATRGRWRHLAWLYPAATTLVVLASANHFLLDAVGGLAVAGLGMLAAGPPARRPARWPGCADDSPGQGWMTCGLLAGHRLRPRRGGYTGRGARPRQSFLASSWPIPSRWAGRTWLRWRSSGWRPMPGGLSSCWPAASGRERPAWMRTRPRT
jgi:PAP2 superfamily